MKKLFAIVLSVVMVLAVASSAMAAFTWNAGAAQTAESFANRYKVEVVKLATETGIIGTNKLVEAPAATAVNNASVYFYIRLTVSGASSSADAVQTNAKASVSFTSLTDLAGNALNAPASDLSLSALDNGVYYYELDSASFKKLNDFTAPNSAFSAAAIEARVQDTATAKVYAKVASKHPLGTVTVGDYTVTVATDSVTFVKGTNTVVFNRNSDGKVTSVDVSAANTDANFVDNLYTFLGFRAPDVTGGKIYMTDANLRAAFGFDYKAESSATWNANTSAIILDPAVGVGIPKTGDNTSVIGFALVMLALVGAAVAVKKVNA